MVEQKVKDDIHFSLIMPAYNEEKRILPVLKKYYFYLKNLFKNNFEIIVVPNNCKDKTLQIVEDFSKKNKNIIIYNIPYYVGKGGAVMKGFSIAKGDYIGFVDADKSTHPVEFFKIYYALLKNSNQYHGVIASRRIKGAVINPKRTLFQNLSSIIFNLKTRILFGLKYKDTQCGAKLFKKGVAKFFVTRCSEKGWIFDVDLLYICKKNKIRILEHPIYWTDHVEGSKITFIEGLKAMLNIWTYKLKTI